jgi:hypothetical protein
VQQTVADAPCLPYLSFELIVIQSNNQFGRSNDMKSHEIRTVVTELHDVIHSTRISSSTRTFVVLL